MELMVVLVIMGILASGIIMMFTDPTGKVKVAAFELRGDVNLARAVAVKENEDVRIDFDPATESYRIWLDNWDDSAAAGDEIGSPPQDDVYTEDDPATAAKDGDTLVKETTFHEKIKYYEFAGAPPADGPADDPLGNTLTGGNGITLGATTLTLGSNGTCDNAGSVVIYYPQPGSPGKIKGKPYAVVVDNTSTSRTLIQRWFNGAWSRK